LLLSHFQNPWTHSCDGFWIRLHPFAFVHGRKKLDSMSDTITARRPMHQDNKRDRYKLNHLVAPATFQKRFGTCSMDQWVQQFCSLPHTPPERSRHPSSKNEDTARLPQHPF